MSDWLPGVAIVGFVMVVTGIFRFLEHGMWLLSILEGLTYGFAYGALAFLVIGGIWTFFEQRGQERH